MGIFINQVKFLVKDYSHGKIKYIALGFLGAIFAGVAAIIGVSAFLGLSSANILQAMRFFATMRFVESQYVDTVDEKQLVDGAINGMVKSLGDPYSVYLPPDMYTRLKNQTSGQFGGIGVVMGHDGSNVHIISVMDGTPGEKAGLKVNDSIVAVDGKSTSEMEFEHVAMSIRGEAGTDVTLTIGREGEPNADYTMTRSMIHYDTAAGRMIDDENNDVGYIRISSFSENTAEEFKKAYDSLKEKGMKGLIIDLRGNPGGFLTTCVDIANFVVPKGLVVSVVERDGTREEYMSNHDGDTIPAVVIINEASASASEILAGALQDTGAATVIGTTSYGKGSVQVVMPLTDGDAVKLTIAKYYTPNGRSIAGSGITPDILVELPKDSVRDVQLDAAIKNVKDKIYLEN